MQIHLFRNEKQEGPYSEEQVRDMVNSGALSQTVTAWHDGVEEWQPLDKLISFAPGAAIVVPPPLAPAAPAPLAPASLAPAIGGIGWPGNPGKQRVVMMQATSLRKSAGDSAPEMALLNIDDEVDLGATTKADGKVWVRVTLQDGRQGFIAGDAGIRKMTCSKVHQKGAIFLPSPDMPESAGRPLKNGESILIMSAIESNGRKWVKIRDAAGNEGYTAANVKIKTYAATVARSPESDMLVGGAWCLGGIVITAATYSSVAQSGGTYLICWGPVLFGGFRFLKGFFRKITT